MKLLHKIIVFSLLVVTPLLYAQVDSKELQSIGEREIIFENYTGNYDYKESVSSIEGIGKRLSDGLNNDSAKKEYHYLNKYSVYHCISENEADKFNADVISIDDGARVEHIRNVRLIISSYLVNQYRYSKKDAATLAYFITIYNAVYRQDLPYFQNNFKPVVLDYITAENAGLSLKFSEWPGKSRIVIPLSKNPQKGKAGALNTSELSNKDVIDAAKVENDDMSIKERKDLVKIKEKEVKELESEIKKDKSAVEKEKAKNANDEKKLSQNKQTIKDRELWIQAEEKDIAKRKAEIAKMPDGPEKEKALKELAEREKALNEEKDAVEKEKEKLAEEEKALEAQKAETSAKEKDIAEKEEEAENKKEEISDDEEEIEDDEFQKIVDENPDEAAKQKLEEEAQRLKEEKEAAEEEIQKQKEELAKQEEALRKNMPDPRILAGKFYYLKVKDYMDNGHYNNQLSVIDGANRKILKTSTFSNICGKNYYVFKEGVLVIGHQSKEDTSHYLALLDTETLDLKKMGTVNIFQRTQMEIKDDFIYVVMKGDDAYYLAKFDLNLELQAKSEVAVFNDTFMSFYEDFIYLNDSDKNILILDKETLKQLEVLTEN
jgi:hypothetical protein